MKKGEKWKHGGKLGKRVKRNLPELAVTPDESKRMTKWLWEREGKLLNKKNRGTFKRFNGMGEL